MPTLNVVAKPLIGPEPINDKTNAVNSVVIFASKIVSKALLYPFLIAPDGGFPNANSSLILSKIITFASMVIPTVNNNPAIPGNVRVASKIVKIPNNRKRLTTSVRSAIKPNNLYKRAIHVIVQE